MGSDFKFGWNLLNISRVTLFRLERWCNFQQSSFPLPSCVVESQQSPPSESSPPATTRSHPLLNLMSESKTHRSRLRLSDQIPTQHGRLNRPLLNGRGLFETVRINPTKQFFRDLHGIERIDGLIPVRVDVGIRAAGWGIAPSVGLLSLITVLDLYWMNYYHHNNE